MRESETDYYDQKLIKGNYFPFYEKRFDNWLDHNGDYHIIKILLAIACDTSKKRVAIDIGANVGLMSRVLSKHYDCVIAFEPSSQNRACLYRNLDIGANNVIIFPYAVGSEDKLSILEINQENCGGTKIQGDLENKNSEKVQLVRLDKLTKIMDSFGCISFIKMDIQGGEVEALKGSLETIQKHRPLMMIEVEESNVSRLNTIKQIFKQVDYIEFLVLGKEGKDILFIPNEKATNETKSRITEFARNKGLPLKKAAHNNEK